MKFDPSALKPEPRQPQFCRHAEAGDVHGGIRLYMCYYYGNFADINTPCHGCKYFREK